MKARFRCFIVPAALFLILFTACAPTKLTTTYKDKSYEGEAFDSIMVLGVSEDFVKRKLFEEHFVEAFTKRGVKSVASLDVLPKNVKPEKEAIKAAAVENGMNAVLVTHLVGVKEKSVYHPPTYEPFPDHYRDLGRYYPGVYHNVHSPGYYTQHKYVHLESNLYETTTEKLIWSVTSETVDPKSVNEIIDTLCKAALGNLQKEGLIK